MQAHILLVPTAFLGEEVGRRARDRAAYSREQSARWAGLVAKLFVVETENVLGGIINWQPHYRKVFAASFMQGLRHIDARLVCLPGVRILTYIGDPVDMNAFVRKNRGVVARLTDAAT